MLVLSVTMSILGVQPYLNASGLDLDQHFTQLGALQIDGFNGEGLACFPCDGGSGFHGVGFSAVESAMAGWMGSDGSVAAVAAVMAVWPEPGGRPRVAALGGTTS